MAVIKQLTRYEKLQNLSYPTSWKMRRAWLPKKIVKADGKLGWVLFRLFEQRLLSMDGNGRIEVESRLPGLSDSYVEDTWI